MFRIDLLDIVSLKGNTLSLDTIKERHKFEIDIGIETREFEQYLKEDYIQTYNKELNFIGYRHE